MLETTNGDVGSIVIDPCRFLAEVQHHFGVYVAQLRDAAQTDLRQNFELFFDRRILAHASNRGAAARSWGRLKFS